jgi:predicted AAA+ superfamily ATPase
MRLPRKNRRFNSTVQRYLLYMEMSYQVMALPAWSANSLKSW